MRIVPYSEVKVVIMRSLLAINLLSFGIVHALPQAGDVALQGFVREGLASLNAAMHKVVDDKKSASIVTLLARNGKIVNQDAYGVIDATASTKVPVQKVFAIKAAELIQKCN